MDVLHLVTLVEQLPPESNYVRERAGWWSLETHLLAALVELSHAQVRWLMALAGAKPHRIPPPLQVPRPGVAASAPTEKRWSEPARTLSEYRRMFTRWPDEDGS
jgi:hypothetical protein